MWAGSLGATRRTGSVDAMTLYLKEEDVNRLLTMKETMEQLRKGFELQAKGDARSLPRSRIKTGKGTLNTMPAAVDGMGVSGMKAYYGNGERTSFLVVVFSVEDTKPLCVIEASRLGQLRTGAVSGIVTEQLSRSDAKTVGCCGTGYQAETQIEAMTVAREVDNIMVCGRSREKAVGFAQMMRGRYGLNVEAVRSPAEFRDIDILITATDSRQPVIEDRFVPPDCHINAIGANHLQSSELESMTFCSAKTIVVDSKEQAMLESGDLVGALNSGKLGEECINEVWQAFGGKLRMNERATTERTLFKSLGIGLEDVVTAGYLYEKAVKSGFGVRV